MHKRTVYKALAFGVTAILVAGLVALVTVGQTQKWVGSTDLEVRFDVTDAESGQPIPDATIHIRAEAGGFCEDRDAREFTIASDGNGQAKHLCKRCMCFGSSGTFEDTFAVHLPWWWFHITAAGYSDTDPAFLEVLENGRRVQRGDPFATISIPIRLQKKSHSRIARPEQPIRSEFHGQLFATELPVLG